MKYGLISGIKNASELYISLYNLGKKKKLKCILSFILNPFACGLIENYLLFEMLRYITQQVNN